MQLLAVDGAVGKIEVNKRLVRYARAVSLTFEIINGIRVNINSDLLFQFLYVWILSGI